MTGGDEDDRAYFGTLTHLGEGVDEVFHDLTRQCVARGRPVDRHGRDSVVELREYN